MRQFPSLTIFIAIGLSILSILLFDWSFAQAATSITPQLEQQVLEIIREHPEVLIESVQAYQQRQNAQIQQAQQSFVMQLQDNPQQIIKNSPVTGDVASKIVLVEFSDFQCPYCAQAHKTIKKFLAKHKDTVALTYKFFPLATIHSEAIASAKAAWSANQQGKFWQYHDAIFTQQGKLGEALYLQIAQKLNLDLDKFASDRKSEAANVAIQQDIQLAESLGISSTPFLILNGQTLSGAVDLSSLEKVLAQTL